MEEQYMRRAIELARRGTGWTSPNPLVGAVIVKDGKVIGEGWHERCGGLHAERNALKNCAGDPAGGTIYVTLEPCCHHGRTPPCTEAILAAGLSRVVYGSFDPNPKVCGQGAAQLRKAGIVVEAGFLPEECDALNPVFFHYITHKTPYVALKYAMTADGKIATRTGASKWITGDKARGRVQALRHQYRGILVGVGTVLADDPLLNCRMEGGRNPVRIVCDSHLRIPLDSQLCRTAREIPLIIAAASDDAEKRAALEACGAEVWVLPDKAGRVDLCALMRRLGAREIDSVLAEGGGTLHEALLRAGLYQRVYAFIAPKLFGGRDAKTPVEGEGVATPAEAYRLRLANVQPCGQDLLLAYEREG